MDLLSLIAQTDVPAVPLTEQSWFAATMLIVFVVLSGFLGRTIARSVQLNDHGWKLGLILFCVIFSTYYVSTNFPPRFGVDLKGGVTFIVDLNLDNSPDVFRQQFTPHDKNGDGNISKDEMPDELKRVAPNVDSNDDGELSSEEIESYSVRQSKELDNSKESVENVIDQLKKRIDPSGIYEVDLRPLGDDQIEITIPDVDQTEADRILDRIKKAGYLQFRIVASTTNNDHQEVLTAAREQASGSNVDLRARTEVRSAGGTGDRILGRWVDVGFLASERVKQLKLPRAPYRFTLPFNGTFSLNVMLRDSATGQIVDNLPFAPAEIDLNTPAGKRYAEDQKLRAAFYADWWYENFSSKNPNSKMQVLVVEPNERENVEGQDLVPNLVRQTTDSTGNPAVEFTLKRQGVPKFSRLTGNNINNMLGMVLDGELLSAPNINSKIYKNGIIEGDFTSQEVTDLVSILKAGQLKTTLQSPEGGGDLIDSTMGQEMKDRGFWAIGASFVLILVFLIVYYQIAGIVSCMALVLNLLMILAIIMMLNQPLTLNGLAGLVLTVGMSVDANVLIFERIREELAKDATLRMAIRNGFQRATTTIVDANITTFITAFILYVIGNEQLKSFSVALMLGILLSMFTAIFCSRVMFDIFEKKRWLKTLGMQKMFTGTKINFIGKRQVAFVVSAIFIVIGIGAMFVRGGTMLNHDLAGGSMARVVFAKETELATVNSTLEKISNDVEVNGAPAVVTAAKVGSTKYPDSTYYRIESNIKSKDGSESLSDLIKKYFENELAKQTVTLENVKTVALDGGAGTGSNSSGTPAGNGTVNPDPNGAKGESDPGKNDNGGKAENGEKNGSDDPVSSGGSDDECGSDWPAEPVSYQDPAGSQEDDPKGNADQDKGPAKQEEPAKTDSEKTEPKQDDGKTDEVPQDPKVETGTGETTKDQVDRTTEFSGNNQTPDNPPVNVALGRYQTTGVIKFGLTLAGAEFKKKGASLRNDFADAAKSLGFDNYTRNNIQLRDPVQGGGFIGDDVDYSADQWEVVITTQGEDHGQRILEALKAKYNNQDFLPQSKEVGERFAQKAWLRAFAAMFASLIGIVAYIWIRFQRVSFGLAAVAALVHDVLVVLGAIAVSFWLKDFLGIILVEDFKISLAVIAALLTIIGYSLNDTIVVFDRIREVRGKNQEINGEMINRSVNQTLSRTILTSLTTFIVVLILYGAGGDAIHGFAFALVVGVLVGTYSSIFVASPVLLMLMKGRPEVEDAE